MVKLSSKWISRTQSNIFTIIKNNFSKELKNELGMKDNSFSTTDNQNKKAIFPFVYIWFMPSNAEPIDLERKSAQSIDFSVQIDVFDNKSQTNARDVAMEVMRIMVDELSFIPYPIPYFDNKGDVFRMVAIYKRTIDWNDILYQQKG